MLPLNKDKISHEVERQVRDLLQDSKYSYLSVDHRQLLAIEVGACTRNTLIPFLERELDRMCAKGR